MPQIWRKAVASLLTSAFIVTGVPGLDEARALAPWSGTERIAVRQEMVRLALERSDRLFYAESDEGKALLATYDNPNALLQEDGAILVSEEFINLSLRGATEGSDEAISRDLALIRAVRHEDIEAAAQLKAQENYAEYTRVRDQFLKSQSVQRTYEALFVPPPRLIKEVILETAEVEQKADLPPDWRFNDMVARAFELIYIVPPSIGFPEWSLNLVPTSEITAEERAFLDAVKPLIVRNRRNFFTDIFWNPRALEEEIRVYLANGRHFQRVASASDETRAPGAGGAVSQPEPPTKCVTGDTLLVLEDGREVPIVEIQTGDYVLSLNESTQEVEPHRVNALLDMGVKPVYKLTTAMGRSIKTTAAHPYLTRKGWVKVSGFKVGEEIAVPLFSRNESNSLSRIGKSNVEMRKEVFSAQQVKTHPQIGRKTNNGFKFNGTNSNAERMQIDRYQTAVANSAVNSPAFLNIYPKIMGLLGRKDRYSSAGIHVGFDAHPPAMAADFKTDYRTSNTFIDTIGKLYRGIIHGNICVNSSGLGTGMLVGIICGYFFLAFSIAFSPVNTSPPETTMCRPPYLSTISSKCAVIQTSLSSIFFLLFRAIGFASSTKYTVSIDKSQGIIFDRIASIEYVGYEHVYDIEVEGTHNFIGNGIFAHNTYAAAAAEGAPGAGDAASQPVPASAEKSLYLPDAVVVQFLPLMKRMSAKYAGKEDPYIYLSGALKGLKETYDRYPLSHPGFRNFAANRMSQRIKDQIGVESKIRRVLSRELDELREVETNLAQRGNVSPTIGELKEESGLPVEDIYSHRNIARALFFSEIVNSPEADVARLDFESIVPIRLFKMVKRRTRVREDAEEFIMSHKGGLTKIERYVLTRYYLDPDRVTLKEIGLELNISEGRISQILKGAINKLRKAYNPEKADTQTPKRQTILLPHGFPQTRKEIQELFRRGLTYEEAVQVRDLKIQKDIRLPKGFWNNPITIRNMVFAALDTIEDPALGNFKEARKANDIKTMASLYRKYVIGYKLKGKKKYPCGGQWGFFAEVAGMSTITAHARKTLPLESGCFDVLIRFVLPNLIDDDNPNALKSHELKKPMPKPRRGPVSPPKNYHEKTPSPSRVTDPFSDEAGPIIDDFPGPILSGGNYSYRTFGSEARRVAPVAVRAASDERSAPGAGDAAGQPESSPITDWPITTLPVVSNWEKVVEIAHNAPVVDYKERLYSPHPYHQFRAVRKGGFEAAIKEGKIITNWISKQTHWGSIGEAIGFSTQLLNTPSFKERGGACAIIFELTEDKAREYGISRWGGATTQPVPLGEVYRAWVVWVESLEQFNRGEAHIAQVLVPGISVPASASRTSAVPFPTTLKPPDLADDIANPALESPASLMSTGQSLILYADDLLENTVVLDLEETIRRILPAIKGGKIILFAEKEGNAALLEKKIKRIDETLEVITLMREELQSERVINGSPKKEVEGLLSVAAARFKVKKENILAIAKGPTPDFEELADALSFSDRGKKDYVPLVFLGTGEENGLYLLYPGIARAARKQDKFIMLHPVRPFTEEMRDRYLRSLEAARRGA